MGDMIVMIDDNECRRSPASLTKPRGRVTFTYITYTILLVLSGVTVVGATGSRGVGRSAFRMRRSALPLEATTTSGAGLALQRCTPNELPALGLSERRFCSPWRGKVHTLA